MSAELAGTGTDYRAKRLVRATMRRLALDRNPLRPREERLRVWTGWLALAAIGLALPMLAPRAAAWAHRTETAGAQVTAAHRHPVRATLLLTARAYATMPTVVSAPERVPAVWTAPDGTRRRGEVEVAGYVPAGGRVTIFVDDRGGVTAAPKTPRQIRDESTVVGIAAWAAAAACAGVLNGLVRRALRRRRYAQWELRWAVLAPEWTRKY